jgi:hypothetical protein
VQQKTRSSRQSSSSSPTTQVSQPKQIKRYPCPLPENVDVDVLGLMLDEDLVVRFRALDDARNQVIDARMDPRPWEEEIAYVRREQQIRRVRRDAHDRYVRSFEREYSDSESGLPFADLDNSSFTDLFPENY